MKIKPLLMAIITIAIIMFSFKYKRSEENKAVEYMNYLSEHKVRGGCFYIKNDSVTTFKNYK